MAKKVFKKEQILHAAYEITRDQDLSALSMRAIARKIGCSVMPIYDSFDSKEDLIHAVNIYALRKTLYDLSGDTIYDRYDGIIEYGFKYHKFLLDFVRFEKAFEHETDDICRLCDFMAEDERFKNVDDREKIRVNARIEAFIVGVLYTYYEEDYDQRLVDVVKKVVRETTDHIINGVLKIK